MSRFRPGDWLLVAGGLVMLVLGLALDWTTAAAGGIEVSGDGPFKYFVTGGIAWLLVVAAGVIAFLLAAGVIKPGTTPWSMILLLMTGLGTLLMLIRIVLGGRDLGEGIDVGRGPGMWIALVAAALAVAGAAVNYVQAGGRLSDLTDMDRMRGNFGRSGTGSVPPPPPPGGAPPPPPRVP